MTENKQFTLHIVWFNYDKTEGEATLKDNGQPLLESECISDMRRLKDLLNELNDKAEHNRAWGESNARIMFSLGQYLQAYDEILDAFINGIEDEKGIAPDNQEFQEKMDFALKYLKRLKEEYINVDDYLEKKKETEKCDFK